MNQSDQLTDSAPKSSYKPIEAASKAIKVLLALKGNEFDGLALKQVCDATGLSAPQAGNYLESLRVEGVAEQIEETGRWRLGPKVIQVALAFMAETDRKRSQLEDISNRYTRRPG